MCCLVRKRPRKPSLEESSFSEISSSSSDSEELSGEEDAPHLSPSGDTNQRIVHSDSEEESEDDSDIYEQFKIGRKLSVNSVYSNEESSAEEEQQREDVVEKSPSPLPIVHTDHDYAKPVIASESEEVSDKEQDEDEKEILKKREEMLTAQARQHSFPKRSTEEEERNMRTYLEECGPDQEEVKMFKLALKKMKEANDELVSDVSWSFYPSDILYCVQCVWAYVVLCVV